MLAIITLPSPGDLWTGVGSWSTETFTQFLPWAYFAIGIILGGMLISFFAKIVLNGLSRLTGRGNESNEHGYFESAEYKRILK